MYVVAGERVVAMLFPYISIGMEAAAASTLTLILNGPHKGVERCAVTDVGEGREGQTISTSARIVPLEFLASLLV